jgi:FAD:protein FMN transferase
MFDAEFRYRVPDTGLEARGEYVFVTFGGLANLRANNDSDPTNNLGRTMYGYSGDLAYHLPLGNTLVSDAVKVRDWTYQVLEAACELYRRSGGMFDISVAPALQRGGIAKGFAVDCAVEALHGHGVAEGLVNAGGDLRGFGPRSHVIDNRDPRQPERPLCRVALGHAAFPSSAGRFNPLRSRQARRCAVIDPAAAMPVRSIIGATVCAGSCVIADALTKVVMNGGEAAAPTLEYYWRRCAVRICAQRRPHKANWKNEMRLAA